MALPGHSLFESLTDREDVMKLVMIVFTALALLLGAAARADEPATALSTEELGITCDRACLIGVMDQYLAAMIAHNPAGVDFATHVKFTENGVVLPIGTATWQTMDSLGAFKQYVADPQGQSVGFLGTFMERGHESILSVRLKLSDRVIEEAEQIVLRKRPGYDLNDPAGWDERTQPGSARTYTTADWNDTLKPGERVPRDRMIAIANSYFSAIQGGAATPVPFAPNCYRIENGVVTSGAAATGPDASNGVATSEFARRHCAEQLNIKGFFVFDNELRGRRFSVVDEEKGIVFAQVFFDHAGTAKFHMDSNGNKVPMGSGGGGDLPNSIFINEIFWIKNGVIQHIAANIITVPYGMPSGWEQ
jgi:hypothetical protein